MLEVELKASLKGFTTTQIKEASQELGFNPQRSLREIDVYFNGSSRDFRTTDEALRLRSCQDLDSHLPAETLITYKGPKQDTISNTRTEYETAVGDLETMKNLLNSLGYTPTFTVEKTRLEFVSGQVTLCLDTVKELGDYLELELLVEEEAQREQAIQQLLDLLDAFQIPRDNLTQKSYLELLYL